MATILELYLPNDFEKRFEKFKAKFDDEKANEPKPIPTSTDYVVEAINFFKDEYNKVKMVGLKYDYDLGENSKSEQTDQNYDIYDARLRAIDSLLAAGFVTEYHIEERIEGQGLYIWDYAVCKIDESKITEPVAPRASEKKVDDLIQEITINQKSSERNPDKFWVSKKGQEIWVNDKYYLTKPNYHDDNERFFDYAFEKAKPTIEFTKEQLEAETKRTFSKDFNKLVNGLKFTGQIRKAFFPKVNGKTAVEFRKEVEANQLQNEGINIELLIKELEVSHGRSKK